MDLCQLATQAISNLQDFMADMTAEWWPVVGRKRLTCRIECIGGRPELALVL